MNEPDFSAFAALWQQEPAQEEVRIFRKLAARASLRARLLRRAESLFGVVIAIGAGTAFLLFPGLLSGMFALLLAVAAMWTAWQRHRFDAASAQLSRRDREDLLASSAASARAALRKSTVGVATALPGGMLALALTDLVVWGHGDPEIWADALLPRLQSPAILASLLIMTAVTMGALWQNRRLRHELARIEALRAIYREEDQLDRAAAARSPRAVNR